MNAPLSNQPKGMSEVTGGPATEKIRANPPGEGSPKTSAALPQPAVPSPIPPDDRQERDVWWGSYAGRTLLPSFLVCGLLTIGIAIMGTDLYMTYGLDPDLVRYLCYALGGTIWVFQAIRWGYRVTAMNYRLTNRRLFHTQGFLYPPRDAVELTTVTRVLVEHSWLERFMKVGTIRILRDGPTNQPVVLTGLAEPERVRKLIDREVEKARTQSFEPRTQ
jgi:hypothetical protein